MQITVQAQGLKLSSALYRRTRRHFDRALSRFRESIVDVHVYLKDVNGPKGGIDKAALVKIDLGNQQSVVVETESSNLLAAIGLSARRARRAVRRSLGRQRTVSRRLPSNWQANVQLPARSPSY